MSTFNAEGSDVDVEAIMSNIRRRIDKKRKGMYTEDEVREIAEMKLDAVLDSKEFNSDFVAAFLARDATWNFSFNPETIYASSRAEGGGFIRSVRRLLNPFLKLFFNPNPVISAPSNMSLSFLHEHRVEVVTGLNLPMLIRLATQRDEKPLEELARVIKEYGQRNISVASELIPEGRG